MKPGDLVTIKHGQAVNGKLAYVRAPQKARVMGICEGYAMLRFKGCAPFIRSVKELEKWAASPDTTDSR